MRETASEKLIREWIVKHKEALLFAVMLMMSLYVRFKALPFQSVDYRNTLQPWYETIRTGGFHALAEQIGDYPIPYQILIWLLTLIPGEPIVKYKTVFFLSDLLMALTAGKIADCVAPERKLFAPVSACVMCLPEVILNSGYWAQSDSIWSGFCLLALYSLMKRKYGRSVLFLGIAFSFKIQTVFLFPLFVMFYLREGGFSILNALVIPLVFFALCLPAFLAGRPVFSLFSVYFMQIYEYHEMVVSFPSFWSLTQLLDFHAYYRLAVVVAFAILGLILYLILKRNICLSQPDRLLVFAVITTWTCVYFLPSMHERYGYLTDILLVILILCDRDYLPFGIWPLIVSILSYAAYLSHGTRNLELMALVHLIAYLGVLVKARSKHCFETAL